MADIKYLITVDSTGAIKSMKDFETTLNESAGSADDSKKKHKALLETIVTGQAIYDAAKSTLRGAVNLAKESVQAAMDDERSQRDLEAAITQTGRSYKAIGPEMERFAALMERDTLYTDEQVRSSAALMFQMTDLDAKGVQRAIRGAAGLATVMKTDLNSASMLIMKAMEGNTSSLSRYGIKVDENLSAEQKRASILDQLEGMYGRATAATDTLAGKTKQLKKSWENAKEELGKTITQGGIWKATLEVLTGATEALQEGLKSKKRKLEEAVLAQKAENDANAEAYESLRAMGEQIGWSSIKLYNLTQQYHLNYIQLQEWIAGNMFGKEAADALARAKGELTASEKSYYDTLKALGIPTLKESTRAAEEKERKIRDLDLALKDGVIGPKEYAEGIKKIKGAHEEAVVSGEKLRDVMARITAGFIKFRAAVNPAQKAYDDFMDSQETSIPTWESLADEAWANFNAEVEEYIRNQEEVIRIVGVANPLIQSALDNMQVPPDTKTWQDWGEDVQGIIQNVFGGINNLLNGMESVSQQTLQNTLANLDVEYEARRKAIEQSILDEETKALQLAALEEEFEAKKTKVKREAAKKQKALDIAQAISGVAQAVIAALQTKPFFPLGLAMAAMAAAMGAAQIAAIKAQPIPLAGGAVFRTPTEFFMPSGQKYVAGEAGMEIMAGERAIRKVIREEAGGGERNRGARQIANFPIYLDGRKVGGFVLETVQEGIDLKKIKIRTRNIDSN